MTQTSRATPLCDIHQLTLSARVMSRKAVRNRGREGAHDGILGTDWLDWRGLVLSCTHTTAHSASANTHTHTHIRELAKKLHLRKTAIFQELIEAGKIPLRPGVSRLVPI